MRLISTFSTLLGYLVATEASVTALSQVPYFYATQAAPTPIYSNGVLSSNPSVPRAYDTSTLNPPALPNPLPATQWGINIPSQQASMPGVSIPIKGSFLGFSIEMSVVTQVIGLNSTHVSVPFLNLMSTLAARSGSVHIRVGGNTQDYATWVQSTSNGQIIEKENPDDINNPTATPPVIYTDDMFYLMNNVSALTSVQWYLGIPFNDTTNLRLQIAELGDSILGENILGYQLGNEPDLYGAHGHRASTYSQYDYFGEIGTVLTAVNNDPKIATKNNIIVPNLSGAWTPESVWDTGFIPAYTSSIGVLSVEHYPNDNCLAIYGGNGQEVDPQGVLPNYLNHGAPANIVNLYLNSSAIALQAGKPLMMFETNTASCGGFPGISNAFAAALWGVDYTVMMAAANFSGALFHVGGRDVFYNPFTPPQTNETAFREWTIGPLMYTEVLAAEIFGKTGTASVIDLQANGGNQYTPAYAVYENNVVSKFVIINYLDDPTGANTNQVTIQYTDGAVPSTVAVKLLTAPSTTTIGNITWAGQTFGGIFQSDGRLHGTESIQTVTCNTGANSCQVNVPAPGVAIVFMSSDGSVGKDSDETKVFTTSVFTNAANTATLAPGVIETSNGQNGKDRASLGSTSLNSRPNSASSIREMSGALLSVVISGLVYGLLGGF